MRRMTSCAVVLTVFLFLFTSTLFAGSIQVPQTGQTKCYNDAGAEVSCPDTGQDGELRTGVAWPAPRFTVGTGVGVDCITDNLTGLMWARNATAPDCMSWEAALAYANAFEACGYTGDWRLPNVNEMESLTNYAFGFGDNQIPGLADWLMGEGFTNVIKSDAYWSSTTNEYESWSAWGVDVSNATAPHGKGACLWVWPIRTGGEGTISLPRTGQVNCFDGDGNAQGCSGTGQDGDILAGVTPPGQRFTASGDCVTDLLTGLTWVKTPDDTARNWEAALTHANGLTLCGYSDWRLPNIKELRSLVDFGLFNPSLPAGHPFENVQSNVYWSSTTDPFYPVDAWAVNFYHGEVIRIDAKDFAEYYAWPVRSEASQVEGISVTPSSKNFGTVAPGGTSPAQVFTVAYDGAGSVTVNGVSLAGAHPDQFQKVSGSDQCTGQMLTSGAHCTVQVLFSPTSTGAKTAELTITSTSGTTPTLVATLKGTGGTPGGIGTIELPQTGQTKCYNDAGVEVSCPYTGQDGELRTGAAWPAPRFTVGTGVGVDCITDNLTGLMWARNATAPDCMSWEAALAYANAFEACGYTGDWRLPNVNEMESLTNYAFGFGDNQIPGLADWLMGEGFTNVIKSDAYWSSTTNEYESWSAWGVDVSNATAPHGKGACLWVWSVRTGGEGTISLPRTGQVNCFDGDGNAQGCSGTGQDGDILAGVTPPGQRFTASGDCVTDLLTGLTWVKTPDDTARNWEAALTHANGLTLCGYSDWRLPNIKELRSLVDFGLFNPSLPAGHPFENVQSNVYWSSTTDPFYPVDAWAVNFYHGEVIRIDAKDFAEYYAWPVRTAEPVGYTLSVTKTGTGTGSVVSTNPVGGIDCGSDCSESYPSGTPVTLSASASAGSTFAGWSGACTGTGTCTVTMDQARSVTATFNLDQVNFTLTVTKAGTGSGTVTSTNPAGGIDCGSDCSESYPSGTPVTLSASASAGSTFVGWSGACTGTGTCQMTMDQVRGVTATFDLISYTLTVTKAGTGSGTVTSINPAGGIICGSDCSESYPSGTPVTLSASADTGSTFAGWSGACTGTGTCQVTMDQVRGVTATFVLDQVNFTLTVTKAGTGSGTVTSTNPPGGINCGSDCLETYPQDTVVTLAASPSVGSTFVGWSGACTGTGSCQVTMSEARGVTATFDTVPAGPYITDITPDPFGLGVSLTIRGGHFGTKKPTVFFGTTKAKVTSYDEDEIVCSLLKGAADVYPVRVVVKKVGESAPYDVELHAPVIDSTSVPAGVIGAQVTINGQYFGAKKPKVYFVQGTTSKAAKVSTYSDTQLLITVPKVKVTGAYVIKVTNKAGTSNEYPFTVN